MVRSRLRRIMGSIVRKMAHIDTHVGVVTARILGTPDGEAAFTQFGTKPAKLQQQWSL